MSELHWLDRPIRLPRLSASGELIREKSVDVAMAMHRLLRVVPMLPVEAQGDGLEDVRVLLASFMSATGARASFGVTRDMILVGGELLHAPRGVHDQSADVAALYERAGVAEVAFEPDVSVDSLAELVVRFALATAPPPEDPSGKRLGAAAFTRLIASVHVRPAAVGFSRDDKPKPLPIYASSLAVMRRFYEAMAAREPLQIHRVKRVAQALVSLAETAGPDLAQVTTLARSHRDAAGRALQSAIVSLLIARVVTRSRVPLARLAFAALLAESGGVALDRESPPLADREGRIPGATAGACVGALDLGLGAATAAVAGFEATWLERAKELGSPHEGALTPLIESRVLHVARAFLEHLAPRGNAHPASPLEALRRTGLEPATHPDVYRCLVRALGVAPIGTVVELATGEWAIVVGESEVEGAPIDRPRVAVITDARGHAREEHEIVDLGRAHAGVSRVLEPKHARFNVARVFAG
jgi:hypothetical protein